MDKNYLNLEKWTKWVAITRYVAAKGPWDVTSHPTREDARAYIRFYRNRNPLTVAIIMKRQEITL